MRVLYVDMDTLRPDHLGCYGYERDTSPNMDRVAAQGVRFDQYYCSDAPCLPSRASLFSGRFGIHNGAVGQGGTTADFHLHGPDRDFRESIMGRDSLAFLFRRAGMHTASISTFSERHSSWWACAGFNEVHNIGLGGIESGAEVQPVAINWLRQNAKKEDWFLHINYWDPHTPYRAPAEFGNPFEGAPLPAWMTEEVIQHQIANGVGPHGPLELNMYDNTVHPQYPRMPGQVTNLEEYRAVIDGYDCGIRYMDSLIGQLFDELEAQGVFHDVCIILSSDHGESLGELGIYSEHATADHIVCRIPMIMKWNRCRKGRVDRGLHYHLDLLPTLCDLLELEPSREWDGVSYAGSLLDGADAGRPYLVLSQMSHVCQRSVRFDNYIYMRTYHDGYHFFEREMLFDVEKDYHLQTDLALEKPEITDRAAALYLDWHDQMMLTLRRPEFGTDPLWTVMGEGGPHHTKGKLDQYCAYLRKTNRDWAEGELKKRHPNGV